MSPKKSFSPNHQLPKTTLPKAGYGCINFAGHFLQV
jgi:hypothetical protein